MESVPHTQPIRTVSAGSPREAGGGVVNGTLGAVATRTLDVQVVLVLFGGP